MDLHDFGSVVWAIFIAIAVISSIVRSARRTAQNVRGAAQPRAVQARASQPQVPPSVPARPAPQAQSRVQRIVATMPSPTQQFQMPAPAVVFPQTPAPPRRAQSIFGSGPLVARGIIALEVLGPPRALREWSSIV